MSVRKRLKKIGRRVQKVGAKVVKYATPAFSTLGTFIGGPLVGGVVTAAGAAAARGMGATAARAKGKKGRVARRAGRKALKKTFKLGLAGTGAGALGAGVVSVATGGNLFGGMVGGLTNLFGIDGGTQSPNVDITPGGREEEVVYRRKTAPGAQDAEKQSEPSFLDKLLDAFGEFGPGEFSKDQTGKDKVTPFGGTDADKPTGGIPAVALWIGAGILAVIVLSGSGKARKT